MLIYFFDEVLAFNDDLKLQPWDKLESIIDPTTAWNAIFPALVKA